MSLMIAFVGALVASLALGAGALRWGWIDRREGVEDRKPDVRPIPVVGGAAILIGVAAAALFGHGSLAGMAWPGLLAAFGLGLLDDLLPRGLGPAQKLAGQLLVGLLVAFVPGDAFGEVSGLHALGLGIFAVVAMNLVNTFDHADGAAGLLGAFGLWTSAPVLAAATAGYLPSNTVLRGPEGSGGHRYGPPRAMLGDSGSHLLGVAMATSAAAPWLLVVPAIDLIRVVLRRREEGRPAWVGDRTHLAHRLQVVGLGPVAVAGVVAVILAPAAVGAGLFDSVEASLGGAVVSAGLLLGALAATESAVEAEAETRRVEGQAGPGPSGSLD